MRSYLLAASALLAATPGYAGHPAAPPVPPALEIEVMDPGASPTGDPAVRVVPTGPEGGRIDIPPTLLVHRFYYTGDRTFQGPRLPGGPSILVFGHPKTGERLYVPCQMLPGAPRVTYTHAGIRYDYGPQSITVSFNLCGHPKVAYGQRSELGESLRQSAKGCADTTREFVQRTGIPDKAARCHDTLREITLSSADRLNAACDLVALPFKNAAQFIPGAVPLTSGSSQTRAELQREREVARTGVGNRADPFVAAPR